jgi:hypothetical protein
MSYAHNNPLAVFCSFPHPLPLSKGEFPAQDEQINTKGNHENSISKKFNP